MVHATRPVFTLMKDLTRNLTDVRTRKETSQLGKILERVVTGNPGGRPPTTLPDLPRASSLINDNYYVTQFQTGLLAGRTSKRKTIDTCLVNLSVVTPVPTVPGHSQGKDLSPGPVECYSQRDHSLKYVKGASCVTQLSYVPPVASVKNVVSELPVGARLQNFWQVWLDLGAGPKVIQILKEGYTLPFRNWPRLARHPTVVSCYANPHRNSYLLEALHQLIDKNAVELVLNQTSLGFFNRLFLVPKPNNKWRPILDLSQLNLFLKVEKFKMETPETIRTSLQRGEWVTSVDFKDAYFHIPIQEQSKKYLRFHVQGRTYQFKALPFGLSTASMEFTVLAKEVKLMAGRKGIRIHQYLDDWLVRAKSYHICLQHTQSLVKMCQALGWLVNTEKSELVPKQVFNFVGYQFNLRSGRVRPTPDRWQSLQDKIQTLLAMPACPAVYVPDRFTDSHGETSSSWPATHEAYSVAPQKQLEGTGIPGEDYRSTQVPAPTLAMVARGRQSATRSTVTPGKTCSANIYRRIKRRVGCSLKRAHCKRVLVGAGKPASHKLSRVKSGVSRLERVPRALYRQDCAGSNRQHHSGSLHKQRGRHEVGPLVCPVVENPDLVFPETSDSKSTTHTRTPKCDSGQAIQAGADHPSRVVPPSRGFSKHMRDMTPTSNRSVCHEVQPQITSVCVSSSGPSGCSSGCTHTAMGGSGCICLPTDRHLGQSGGEATGHPVQKVNSNCSGMAQHALVLGLGDHVQSNPSQLAKSAQSVDTALQSDPSNLNLLEPQQSRNRASLRLWQRELRLLKEDQPDQSMRQSGPFFQSGASLIRWTSNHHL